MNKRLILLLLFTCGLYFTYRAVESHEEGRTSMSQALIAAVFFGVPVAAIWLGSRSG